MRMVLVRQNVSVCVRDSVYMLVCTCCCVCVHQHSRGPSVPWSTHTLPGVVPARGSVQTAALQQAAITVATGLAGVLTAPALVALCAHTRPRDGAALGTMATLAAVTAVGAPEIGRAHV